MILECKTKSPTETQKVGRLLAKEILDKPLFSKAFLLALEGDLGGGKTTFLQGFAKGLQVREGITSPTFVLMKRFPIAKSKFKNFFHIDCYRTEGKEDVLALGFKEIIKDPENIVAVEWADKIKKILPKEIITINFEFIDKNKRKITFTYGE